MPPPLRPQVEPCSRCGRPAERPVEASGQDAGRGESHLPLCVDCLLLLLEDVRRFWEGMGRGPPRQKRAVRSAAVAMWNHDSQMNPSARPWSSGAS